jgi:low temperature requirement protein LtrA
MVTRRLHAPEAQAVTFVELFFDLVFVYAVTQVTVLTVEDLTLAGVARSVLVFWLIWWAWTQFTWTLNPADTTRTVVRVLTLLATAVAFVMAASVTRAFGSEVWWFVVPYLVVRLIGLAMQVRIDLERQDEHRSAIWSWVGISLLGLGLVLVGAFADTPARYVVWSAAIVVDLVAASRGAGRHDWEISPAHFCERHGLFVIIAIGESLIVTAAAVSGEPRTSALVADVAAALAVACLLWWTYFGWLKDDLERGLERAATRQVGAVARDAFSFGHFPLVCGIIGFAVAIEEIAHHPNDVPPAEVTIALGAGIALFVAMSSFAAWRTSQRVLLPRIATLAVTLVALALVSSQEAVWQLATVAFGLLVIVILERPGTRCGAPTENAS